MASTRIAGTFFFTAAANQGTTPASTTVTNGAFDITVATGLPDLPTGVGSTSIANLGGTPWNAATVVGTNPGGGVFGYSASNTAYSLTVVPRVPVSAGHTYGVPSQISMTVIQAGGVNSWWGGAGSDVGTLVGIFFTRGHGRGGQHLSGATVGPYPRKGPRRGTPGVRAGPTMVSSTVDGTPRGRRDVSGSP
jgi:hypothetical protein